MVARPPGEGAGGVTMRLPGELCTRVHFRWKCENLEFGEKLRVVGDCPELGDWQPANGAQLTALPGQNLYFRNKVGIKIPLHQEVQYKYVICNARGELKRWESRLENRILVPTGERHVVEDDGGKGRALHALENEKSDEDEDFEVSSQAAFSTSEHDAAAKDLLSKKQGSSSTLSSGGRGKRLLQKKVTQDDLTVEPDDHVFLVALLLPMTVTKTDGKWSAVIQKEGENPLISGIFRGGECSNFNIGYIGCPGVFVDDPEDQQAITKVLAEHNCFPVFAAEETYKQHAYFAHQFLWPVLHSMKVFFASTVKQQVDIHFMKEQKEESASEAVSFDESQWAQYQALNQLFAEACMKYGKGDDLIWIHDYHLLTVPHFISTAKKIRARGQTVGLFLQTPFPGSEVWLCLPNREQLVRGMLSADVVSFQIFDYMRNFLSSCEMLLGVSHSYQAGGVLCIDLLGHSTVVTADHAVVPFKKISQKLKDPAHETRVQALREKYGGKKIIFSVDRCDHFSGLLVKLRAFKEFLQTYRQHIGTCILVQYAFPPKVDSNVLPKISKIWNSLAKDLESVAKDINDTFPGGPHVNLRIGQVPVDETMALFSAGDILFDTSLSKGLNLRIFEFFAAHSEDRPGLAVVSEFSGCSRALTGSIRINPWDTQGVIETLDLALVMGKQEVIERFLRDHSYVSTQELNVWATKNLVEIKLAREQRKNQKIVAVHGFGADFQRLVTGERGYQRLDTERVVRDYQRARNRVIFLDDEGTLVALKSLLHGHAWGAPCRVPTPGFQQTKPNRPEEDTTGPEEHTIDVLRALGNDKCNVVVVLSGRTKSTMDKWFEGLENVGLCAEHGYFRRLPPRLTDDKSSTLTRERSATFEPKVTFWEQAGASRQRSAGHGTTDEEDTSEDWQKVAFELMKIYANSVQGSEVEARGSCISWSYHQVARGAPSLAIQFAKTLAASLDPDDPQSVMYGYPVSVDTGKGYVEVKRCDLNKGTTVSNLLEVIRDKCGAPPDFVLCIGDDRSDEDMFEVVNRLLVDKGKKQTMTSSGPLLRKLSGGLPKPSSRGVGEDGLETPFYSVTVGRKPSKARYFLDDPEEVESLLKKLATTTTVSSLARNAASVPCFQFMPLNRTPMGGGVLDEEDELDAYG